MLHEVENTILMQNSGNKAIEKINFQGRLKEVVVLRDFQNGVPMVLGNEGELIQVFTSIIDGLVKSQHHPSTGSG